MNAQYDDIDAQLAALDAEREGIPQDAPPRAPLNWRDLSAKRPPLRDWAVDHWLPMGHPALLAGSGGVGKTLLAQTLGTCLALEYEYIDVIAKPRRVLMWAGEDERDELWRRQIAICNWLNVDMASLDGRFIVESYIGRDITLAGTAYGALTPTPLFAELRAQIGDYKADYVFIDSTARVFGGVENDRHQVTTFIAWLTGACATTGAGLCLLAHPGKATASEFSGSTAWEASVRSRLYLGRKLPDRDDPDDEGTDTDTVRYLARRKANYAETDYRKLNYADGVLVPETTPRQTFTGNRGEFAQDVVLRTTRKLAELGMHGNASTRSPDYLPKLAKQYRQLDGLTEREFTAAMRELIVLGRLASQPVGRYPNRSPRNGLVEVFP